MRKGARFTAKKLQRWKQAGRGLGTEKDYIPWHQVTRGDPSSRGRSHIQRSALAGGRQQHLLSDGELIALMLVWALPDVHDVLEQFPLNLEYGPELLSRYHIDFDSESYPGSLEICRRLALKHPRVLDGDHMVERWVMTTDLVVVRHAPKWQCIAISVKPDEQISRRAAELLKIEAGYWQAQNTPWVLLCMNQLSRKRRNAIMAISGLVLPNPPPELILRHNILDALGNPSSVTLNQALIKISAALDVDGLSASRLFWQCVWLGDIPLSFECGFGRGGFLRLEEKAEFIEANHLLREFTIC